MPEIWPRRVDISAEMSPKLAAGTVTSTETIGSSRHGRGLLESLAERGGRGGLERLLRAVDRVILAEVDLDLEVDDLVARDDSLFQSARARPSRRRGCTGRGSCLP